MRSLFVIRSGRREWQVLPSVAVRGAAVALSIVVAALFALDRIALPMLERRGLTAGADWQRHNALVVAEHRAKDTSAPVDPALPIATRFGVRSWQGHPVERRTKPRAESDPVRILVMGDSFVWGSPYLTLNHMWWRQLEMELVARGYDVEVIAAGQSGASTRDQLAVAKRIIPEYRPDLIIWGYVTNDADVGLVRQISQSQQSQPGFNRIKDAAARVWPRLIAKFDALRAHKLAKSFTGPEYGYEYGEWELKLVEASNLSVYQETVRGVSKLMAQHQLPGFMLTLPGHPSTKHFAPRLDPVIHVWRDAGVPSFNVLPAFVAQYGEVADSGIDSIAWGINPADGHPGPRACRFLARQAVMILEQHFEEQLGQRGLVRSLPLKLNDVLPSGLKLQVSPSDPQQAITRGEHPAEGFQLPKGSVAWKLLYPGDDARLPFMPEGVPSVLLALQQPESLSSISLNGSLALTSARLWIETRPRPGTDVSDSEDRSANDDEFEWHDLGVVIGNKPLGWTVPDWGAARVVSALRFRADFKGPASVRIPPVGWTPRPSELPPSWSDGRGVHPTGQSSPAGRLSGSDRSLTITLAPKVAAPEATP